MFGLFLAHFPYFRGKNIIFKKSGSVIDNNTFLPLTLFWVPEKSKEPTPRKYPDRKKDGQTLFIRPFWP